MTLKERRRKLKTTQFEQALLCILFATEPKSLSLPAITDEVRSQKTQSDVAWALRSLEALTLVERGTDPSTWQLTSFGRKYWKELVRKGLGEI
jgi:hypothetical protein